MEKALEEDSHAIAVKVLEDKLHAIAVQLGRLNEFAVWMRTVIEAEIKKDSDKKGGVS